MIAGAPVLREPAGERSLTPGDLVCFPSGHRRRPHRERAGPVRDLRHRSARRAVPERLPRLGQGQRPGGHPPPNERRRLLARRGNGGTVGSQSRSCASPRASPPQPAVNVLALRGTAAKLGAASGRRPARRDGGGRWIPERDLSPTTTSTGGSSGCSCLPERPPCATRRARIELDGRRSRVPPGRPGRCSPAAQSRRVGRARALPLDVGPAGRMSATRTPRTG